MSGQILCEKSVKYTRNSNQVPNLLVYANQQRINGFLNDVQLKAGQESVTANRLVLACFSEHFQDKFKTESNNSFVIEGIDGQSLRTLIDYIYDGNIVINNKTVFDLLTAAHKLKLTDVLNYCCEFLQSVITYDSCLYVLNPAKLCGNIPLQQTAIQLVNEHFEKISLIPAFKELSKVDLIYCFSHLNRDQLSETMVYEAIVRWTKHDEDRRREEFSDLFKKINLNRIPNEYLRDVVSKEELVRNSNVCLNIVVDLFPQVLKLSQNNKPETTIVSLGGYFTPSKVTEIFSLTDDPPKQYPDLPMKLGYHSTVKLDDFVYLIGGRDADDESIVTNKVWRMNLNENDLKWEEIKSMQDNRFEMSAAVCFDSLVVSHGLSDNDYVSKTTEVYEKSLNEWKTISSLQQIRYNHQSVACDGKLFAIGGRFNKKTRCSVEQLSDLTSNWKYVKSMSTPRCWFAAVNCKGYIYVIGGVSGDDESSTLKSVERYDHVADKWDYVSDMNNGRSGHSACVLQNKIYVVGGVNSQKEAVKVIDCYDPSRDTWMIVKKAKDDNASHSLVVI